MKQSWRHTRFWKRLMSGILTVVMLVTMLPMTAMAALLDNSPAYNREILSRLEQIVGSDEEAQAYYKILQQYNLLDEDGNAVTSWHIRMDGEDITLEDLRTLLAGDYDPGYYITVDGTPITLGDVATILEIEDYLVYLRETYFDGHQWTAEQQANLDDLMNQIENEGIMMTSDAGSLIGSSGVNHAAYVHGGFDADESTETEHVYGFNLYDAAPGQKVTFHWEAQSGSQPVSNEGDVTLVADDDGRASATIEVDVPPVAADTVQSDSELIYYLKLDGLTNALFYETKKTAWSFECQSRATAENLQVSEFKIEGTTEVVETGSDTWGTTQESKPAIVTLTEDQRNAIAWGIMDTAEISVDCSTAKDALLEYVDAEKTRAKAHSIVISADAGNHMLAKASYKREFDSNSNDESGWNYNVDEYYKTHMFQSIGNIGNEITLSCDHAVTSYTKVDNGWGTVSGSTKRFPQTVTVNFRNTQAPVFESVSAPEGIYYPGQVVPVTMTFSEPVKLEYFKVQFNGETEWVKPEIPVGYSNVVTVPYTVKDSDNKTLSLSSITATDGRFTLSEFNPGGNVSTGLELEGVELATPFKSDAIANVTAQVTGTPAAPKLQVNVSISDNEKLTQWLGSAMEPVDGRWQTKADSLAVSLDGGVTKYPLVFEDETVTGQTGTATIPLTINNGSDAVTYVAELYLDNALVVGKAASAAQQPAKYITAEDLSASIAIQKDGQSYQFENPEAPVIYVQSGMPDIRASISLTGSDYTYGDISNTAVAGTEEAKTADFVWESSDPTVAEISKDGQITPTGKAGTTSISLTARNGGVEGKAVTVTAQYTVESKTYTALEFAAGLTPFLEIPQETVFSGDGQPVIIYWTSNLCDKNGDNETTFAVKVKKENREVYATTVTGTAANPAGSVTIPGDMLKYDYDGGSNTFTVEVSASYGGQTYADTATISLEAQPAQVSLGKLDSYYITDETSAVPISWQVNHLDRRGDASDSEIFRFQITCNDQPVDNSVTLGDGTADGSYSGTYQLNIEDVSDPSNAPSSYRQVYTVTLQAKNGKDSTWSYDSFLLYVYDAEALQVMVDGAQADGSLTMSNRDTISRMPQDQILALKRDIYLKNVISANYGTYAWTEVADQIAWASSDNDVAAINYQQGTLYEDIRNFPYVSYRPTEDFMLSGKTDGKTTITAAHKLTGMTDRLDVTVETLKDRLYLFQCYPQVKTKLTFEEYTDSSKTATKETVIYSDGSGAAAYYAEFGIASDVYCQTKNESGVNTGTDGNLYVGTFYRSELKTGEQDAATMALYPCNNLQLRRAAYAYVYLKTPDDKPYTGEIIFRGGVYVNGEYKENALFQLNGDSNVTRPGNEDQPVKLGTDGKLTVVMDQSQWELPDNGIAYGDQVEYVFQIERKDSVEYYPLLLAIDATANADAYVSSGEATVGFRKNSEKKAHPFVIQQSASLLNYGAPTSLLEYTGKIGPSDSCPDAELTTVVMWWGEEKTEPLANRVQLKTKSGVEIATQAEKSVISNQAYPFSDDVLTYYNVKLDQDTVDAKNGGPLQFEKSTALTLEYYRDGKTLTRREELPFQLCNMLGAGLIENQKEIGEMLATMGHAADTNAESQWGFDDMFVSIALSLAASDSYTTGGDKLFNIQLAPTTDPTKFLGFIEVNIGNMEKNVTGVYADSKNREVDFSYGPGLSEMLMLTKRKTPMQYAMGQMDDLFKVTKRDPVRNFSFQLGGYAESLIYYNENSGEWEIQILDGGFNVGGGLSYTWSWNTLVGPVPLTSSVSIGGTGEVSMDALTVSYLEETKPGNAYYQSHTGNDFLTELRIYLYLRAFAGMGIDYSILALKIGIYGQINLDMQFQWLNRPYMDSESKVINAADGMSNKNDAGKKVDYNLDGQQIKIDGQIGLEFFVKFLFISYEKIMYSYNFNLLNEQTGEWKTIQTSWAANQEAMQDAIAGLLNNKNATLNSIGGQQMLSLDLAPTMESRSYLTSGDFDRRWGEGFSLFALDPDGEQGLKNLESSTYPYADPMVSDDGQLVVYLSDTESDDPANTRAKFAVKQGNSYNNPAVIDDNGYGDSQLSLSGTEEFAVAAWARQTETVHKDEGAVITTDDQMVMMNSSEVCASIYNGNTWDTTQLSRNASPDLAPVSATNGEQAIVFWRAVSSSGTDGAVTTFDQKDTIVYRIYDDNEWSEVQTLYNGTSGSVKGITAAMLDDGTAAVAYTLSTSADITSQEIAYAVVGKDGNVTRNVQATNDGYLDENPQLAAVRFGEDDQRFVLGWYAEQAVATDSARVLDSGSETSSGTETVSDIRLLDFDDQGVSGQLLPDSISQAADVYGVSITSDFRFTKNADSIEDLSILWVERAEGTTTALEEGSGTQDENTDLSDLEAEKDMLKGVKFYMNGDTVRFTGAIDIAEMPGATLIDHFDAYVSDLTANEVKAVLLGTTYGADGSTTTRTVTLADGETQAQVTVPTQTSAMYTATETYQDKIEVPALLADYETIYPGSITQIQFTVENQGIHVIDGLTIQVDNTETQIDTVILPGQSVQVTADYLVPSTGVVDPSYTVTANFTAEGAAGTAETGARSGFLGFGSKAGTNTATGTVYLNLPNLQITDAKILSEENGIRTIQVKLNNTLAASLNQSGRTVRLGFYSDAICETPIESLQPITISNPDDLAMIDEGGYSTQIEFNVAAYLQDEDGTAQEIPDSGVTVYMKAEIIETEDGEEMTLGEPTISDNYGTVTCESLKKRTGQEAILTSTLANEGGKSAVTVDLQNTSLTQTTTGNLVVTLLDENGQVVEQQQSYTGSSEDNGLITLGGEEKMQKIFAFQKTGADVQVTYSDLILNVPSAELTSLTFSNLPGVTLDSFQYNATTQRYECTVSADDLAATTVMASTKSATAKASVTNATNPFSANTAGGSTPGSNAISETVNLTVGQINTITILVEDGSERRTYVLTIRNNGDPDIDWSDGTDATEQYGTEVYYAGDYAVINLHAVAMGDYNVSYQWYSCAQDGSVLQKLDGETSSTLTVSAEKNVGAYYYRCMVTRTMLDGSAKEYWSSVATVQIKKATDNSVTATGAAVLFDGQAHGVTATAAKNGSTLHYSVDGGMTWSETFPEFTAVGVYTVWVYATNPNYEDTEPVSADVVIQETPDIDFKLETSNVADAFASYPDEIKDKYKDAAGLETALKTQITELGVSASNVRVYDVKLLYKLKDGLDWVEATAENFPSKNITVKLPYPEGTNRYNYNFTLLHLVTDPLNTGKIPGSVETMDVTLEADGIRFTTDCLSPFALGWVRRPSGSTGSSSYSVSVADAAHGSVTVSPKQAKYGETVTIEAKPDEGYEVESVRVTTSGGRELSVKRNNDNTYTFAMPGSAVLVNAVFVKTNAWINPFSDVSEDAWYYDAVQYVSENSLMNGYQADLFGPNDDLTRAQLAQILYNLEGKPSLEEENLGYPFADVPGDAWFADAVYWARQNGIVSGMSAELFAPGSVITREQMAAILYRYAQFKGYDVSGKADLSAYVDAADIRAYAVDAMAWANGAKLITGTSATVLSPAGSATRAQVATILMRFCEKITK